MGLFKRFSREGRPEADSGDATPAVEPRHVTDQEFGTVVLESELPVVVDFWAEWCGPCHAIAPAVAKLATEFDGRALVAKLNADEYPEVVMHYGIMGIPTLIIFKNGQEVDRQVGMTNYNTLKNKLERALA